MLKHRIDTGQWPILIGRISRTFEFVCVGASASVEIDKHFAILGHTFIDIIYVRHIRSACVCV